MSHKFSRIVLLQGMLLCMLLCTNLRAEIIDVDLVYIGEKNSSAYAGVQQGLTESNLQGQFLGQTYQLREVALADVKQLAASRPQAILANLSGAELKTVAKTLPDTAIFNISETDDGIRSLCIANLLHVIPSNKMQADAIAQWQQKKPDSNVIAAAWHHDFVKYAARDLNKRFKKHQGQEMDSHAWAGWAAVKIVSDTVAREQNKDATFILSVVKNKLEFDGQKGIAMNFRSNGQLRQPMLLSEQGKLVGEAPVRGVVDTADLDTLGNTECQ